MHTHTHTRAHVPKLHPRFTPHTYSRQFKDGNLKNLGLTTAQGAQVSEYYWAHMNTVYDTLIKRGHFAWQLLWTGQPNCPYKNSYVTRCAECGVGCVVCSVWCAVAVASGCIRTRVTHFPELPLHQVQLPWHHRHELPGDKTKVQTAADYHVQGRVASTNTRNDVPFCRQVPLAVIAALPFPREGVGMCFSLPLAARVFIFACPGLRASA